METRKIPAAACRFSATVEIGDNGENTKTAPIKMTARTGDPVNSPFFDLPLIHDFEGCAYKPRVALDWCHDDQMALGYLNHFDTSTGDLVCSGALVQVSPDDQTAKIMAQSRAGVPFESSIDWRGDAVIEELDSGMQATVNGRSVLGPALIVRKWSLRGVAICLHGLDPNTNAQFTESDTISVSLIKHTANDDSNGDKAMNVETTVVEAEAKPEAVETPADDNIATTVEGDKPVEVVVADSEAVEPVVEESHAEVSTETIPETPKTLSEGEEFLKQFGDRGGVWYAQGKTLAEANQLFISELRTENAELKQRLASLDRGCLAPLTFSEGNDSVTAEHVAQAEAAKQMTSRGVSPAIASLAAAMKIQRQQKAK